MNPPNRLRSTGSRLAWLAVFAVTVQATAGRAGTAEFSTGRVDPPIVMDSLRLVAGSTKALAAAEAPPSGPPNVPATFRGPVDNQFLFDTSAFRGVLRQGGKSRGIVPLADVASGAELAGEYGIVSHYRLLDDRKRYGHAAWDWKSTARSLTDGAVESAWVADAEHPFDLTAVYRWSAPDTLDVITRVTARADLVRFESFLASYFRGFPQAMAYVQACPETGGKPGLLEATQQGGPWQMFPRDEAAVATITDGRWRREPNPVDWKIRPRLAGLMALRRDPARGLTAVLMAPPQDGFAVSMPFGEEGHRSLYLSLFGRDLKSGEAATARTRLVIRRGLTDDQAVALYESYRKETAVTPAP